MHTSSRKAKRVGVFLGGGGGGGGGGYPIPLSRIGIWKKGTKSCMASVLASRSVTLIRCIPTPDLRTQRLIFCLGARYFKSFVHKRASFSRQAIQTNTSLTRI